MKNCIILGSGRSGTSMVAGTISKSGYIIPDDLLPATNKNPRGYFESREIESINVALINRVVSLRPTGPLGMFFKKTLTASQSWLTRIPLGKEISCTPEIAARMKKKTEKEPWYFKDPRFCYTLPAWRPFLKNVVFLCVFRHPAVTVSSILRSCKESEYLQDLRVNFEWALEVWTLMYRHVLENKKNQDEWLFLHYNQVFEENGLKRIEEFIEVPIDHYFPDRSLSRSSSDQPVSLEALKVYEKLCELAGYG